MNIKFFFIIIGLIITTMFNCDMPGPGARGDIYLRDNIELEKYKILNIVSFANIEDEFNILNNPIPNLPETEPGYNVNTLVDHHFLDSIEFPYNYMISSGLGSSLYKNWVVVAWLSNEQNNWPEKGNLYGTVLFESHDRWSSYGGVTENVNIKIDQEFPGSF